MNENSVSNGVQYEHKHEVFYSEELDQYSETSNEVTHSLWIRD